MNKSQMSDSYYRRFVIARMPNAKQLQQQQQMLKRRKWRKKNISFDNMQPDMEYNLNEKIANAAATATAHSWNGKRRARRKTKWMCGEYVCMGVIREA